MAAPLRLRAQHEDRDGRGADGRDDRADERAAELGPRARRRVRHEPGNLLEQLLGPGGGVGARGGDEPVADQPAEHAGQGDRTEHDAERASSREVGVLGHHLGGHARDRTGAPRVARKRETGPVREWTVAGGLIETPAGVLLVRNVRRGGIEDWSTPGGVIDDDDADLLAGLTREVEEETGLRVYQWEGPLYEVHAHAPDMEWRMRCEVHLARAFEGDLRVDDPDGIVVEASFVPAHECGERLASCALWGREPLNTWLRERWAPGSGVGFRYDVFGTSRDDLRVVRASNV